MRSKGFNRYPPLKSKLCGGRFPRKPSGCVIIYSHPLISVFPLAIPLFAGPGTLASILILTTEADGHPSGHIMILTVSAIVLSIAYTLFRLSKSLAYVLGQTGINVVTRVLGVLLAALAVQYIANGAIVVLRSALNS